MSAPSVDEQTDDAPWQWYWGFGEDAETLNGPYETKEAAEDEGRKEAINDEPDEDGTEIMVCQTRPLTLTNDVFDGDAVMSLFKTWNEDAGGDDGLLDVDPTGEQLDELCTDLAKTLAAWRGKHRIGRAWMLDTRNEETFVVQPEPTRH